MPVYLAIYAKRMLYCWEANRFVGSERLKHNDLDQFWKFKRHFEHFPRKTRFLSFGGLSNYLYLFKNHRQVFSWPGELPSFHVKVTKMWFSPNIKYPLEPFYEDFCWRKGISCFLFKNLKHFFLWFFLSNLTGLFTLARN